MGLFGSVSSKQIDEFAKSLARELAARCPPEPGADGGRPNASPKAIVATIEGICSKALAFKNLHKFGIYRKARLGNTFRWELTALGYDKRFAEDVTQRLIVHIARRS
ncbi:MAG: hypothetical protein ACRD3R_06030 [Terriglobales bacterium]